MSGMAATHYPRIDSPAEDARGPARLGRGERQHLCYVGAGQGQLAQKIQRGSQGVMRSHQGCRVLQTLRQGEQLFCERTCCGQLGAHQIKHRKAKQYRKKLWCLFEVPV